MSDLQITKIEVSTHEVDDSIDLVELGHALNEFFYGYTIREDDDGKP